MAGQWGYSLPLVAKKVKAEATKIQSLLYHKINYDCIQENEICIMSMECMYCETEEFWLDLSAKCNSQKKNISGLMIQLVVLSIMINLYNSEVIC